MHLIGNFPLLPLRTKVRGPAYTLPLDSSLPAHLAPEPDSESYDALDEILSLFRANTFFRNFEIQGPPDRLLIYGILWVSECLGKVKPNMSAREAQKEVQNIALDSNFAVPGDPGFPLNQVSFIYLIFSRLETGSGNREPEANHQSQTDVRSTSLTPRS